MEIFVLSSPNSRLRLPFAVNDDGDLMLPTNPFGHATTLCAIYDGVARQCRCDGKLWVFAPAAWLRQELPSRSDTLDRVRALIWEALQRGEEIE